MSKYRKKPVEIEAMLFDGSNAETHEVYQWIETNTLGSFEPIDVIEGREPCPASGVSIDPRDGRMIIATLEGPHWVNRGDYVVRGVQGEFYPVNPDIFEATYEPIAGDPVSPYGVPNRDDLVGKNVHIKLHPWAIKGPTEGTFRGQGEKGLALEVPGGGRYTYQHHEVKSVKATRKQDNR